MKQTSRIAGSHGLIVIEQNEQSVIIEFSPKNEDNAVRIVTPFTYEVDAQKAFNLVKRAVTLGAKTCGIEFT